MSKGTKAFSCVGAVVGGVLDFVFEDADDLEDVAFDLD